jgi:hypothetical protein
LPLLAAAPQVWCKGVWTPPFKVEANQLLPAANTVAGFFYVSKEKQP